MADAHTLRGVVAEIKEEEALQAKAVKAARFAPKILPDPCAASSTGAHRWQYKTGGAASRRTCAYCGEKR